MTNEAEKHSTAESLRANEAEITTTAEAIRLLAESRILRLELLAVNPADPQLNGLLR